MTISSLLSSVATTQQQALASNASQAQSGQSYADWFASLSSAFGSTGSTASTGTGGTSQMSDEMQALLTQLQSGNTTAPSGASAQGVSSAASAVDASAGTSHGAGGHGHHAHAHHGQGVSSDADSGGMLQQVASSLTGDPSAAAGGSSDPLGTGTSQDTLSTTVGNLAAGATKAAEAYAALHGINVAPMLAATA